ncbi:GNAT family N-acetyltransferase [Lipingzhangella sp. LS1_29]|uniref:GNAT family N-acetyltransferase n=1 Tax=Lipingzhangella rawalii TaxID=2055835 RepID=A0ABU2H781_9ACTN|nr:GNAT family N-acetyltransferase [Lipingzhangella rawalii]MDS1271168.1 GNAT family N-acetyltransferase [Lipingzhangella rawalii]
MATEIRTADPLDYERIAAVLDAWWGRDVGSILPRLFLDHFWPTSFVAESAGNLSGFLVGFLSPADSELAYVHAVAVAPDARSHGLARELYSRFLTHARAAGRTRVQAITVPHNHASIAFHEALGFEVSGPVPDYNGPGRDRVVFERRIPHVEAGNR